MARHYRGLITAIDAVILGAAWQRCRVHFIRNVLVKVLKGQAELVAAAIHTIFAQPTGHTGPLVREQVDTVAAIPERQFPAVAAMPRDAGTEITAFAEDVVGIFPNPEALLCLAGCVLIKAHDEW